MYRMKEYATKGFKYNILPQLEDSPTLEADEVLIKVRAAAINVFDVIGSKPNSVKKDLDEILIREISGCIIKVGTSVTHLKIGDLVCAFVRMRGFCKEFAVSSECVFRVPLVNFCCLPLVYAAGLPFATCVTYYAVKKCLTLTNLKEGDLLVMHNQCSFYTYYAVQRAKYFGLRVLLVADSDKKVELFKKLGVDAAINHKNKNVDLVKKVNTMSKNKGADAMLCFGYLEGEMLTDSLKCLAKNGVILHVFMDCEDVVKVNDPRIKVCDIRLIVPTTDVTSLGSLIREALQCPLFQYLKPKTYPLSDAAAIDWEYERSRPKMLIVEYDYFALSLREKLMVLMMNGGSSGCV